MNTYFLNIPNVYSESYEETGYRSHPETSKIHVIYKNTFLGDEKLWIYIFEIFLVFIEILTKRLNYRSHLSLQTYFHL